MSNDVNIINRRLKKEAKRLINMAHLLNDLAETELEALEESEEKEGDHVRVYK